MTMFCEPALQQWQKIVPHPYFEGQIHPPICLINDFICISVSFHLPSNKVKTLCIACLLWKQSHSRFPKNYRVLM